MPVATFAYLIAEAFHPPYVMWAWIGVSAALAAVVHVPEVRRRVGSRRAVASSGAMLVVGVVAAWAHDKSLQRDLRPRHDPGWPSIALAVGAALIFASALLEPRQRSYALWLPYLLAAQLATMLLPGQYALVALSALAALAAIVTLTWPRPIRGWLERRGDRGDGRDRQRRRVRNGAVRLRDAADAVRLVTHAGLRTGRRRGRDLRTVPGRRGRTRPQRRDAVVDRARPRRHRPGVSGGGDGAVDAGGRHPRRGADGRPGEPARASVHDHFQQGHVAVSISWVLVGLALVVVSLRGDRRGVRIGGIALLFVALGKLFLYDLAFLTAMARAVSFIVTGSVLLVAALLLQRFAPQVQGGAGGRSARPGVITNHAAATSSSMHSVQTSSGQRNRSEWPAR